MKFFAKPTDMTKIEADVLAVFAWQGKKPGEVELSDEAKKADAGLDGMLADVLTAEQFEAGLGKTFILHTHEKIPAKRVLVAGLGDLKALTMANWQTTLAGVGRSAKARAAKRVAVALPGAILDTFTQHHSDGAGFSTHEASQGLVEGMVLGTYEFNRHKSEETRKKEKIIEEVMILTSAGKLDGVAAEIGQGVALSEAVIFARDLVNEPPSFTTPTHLGEVAKSLAKHQPLVTCEVLGRKEMETLGMGGILGISRGSDEEPKFIKLTYKGGGRKTIALVGKGITFDTGGLSLKPSTGMETMKMDMAGAAAILGIFNVLPILKPKVNVVGLISACENMPSGKAIKPGDVVMAMSGKTIEILNTDAEGRVVLADALSYAVEKVKPDAIIDLATLTGACIVALGEEIAGLFANDAKLAVSLKDAAKISGENVWELPLASEYKDILKSSVADIKNISGKKYGGAINGALFLQEFVPARVPWAHLDIAGPAFAEKDALLTPVGGTGFGVRMVLRFLEAFV